MLDKIQPNLPAGYTNSVNNIEGKLGNVQNPEAKQIDTQSAEVSISDDALALQRAMQATKEAPDVRTDIVQEIKGQIEAGQYKVDVENLAEKLLPFMK